MPVNVMDLLSEKSPSDTNPFAPLTLEMAVGRWYFLVTFSNLHWLHVVPLEGTTLPVAELYQQITYFPMTCVR